MRNVYNRSTHNVTIWSINYM